MSGITGLGTNYNLPNYTGLLFQLTPSDTPFFSALGGLTGGRQTESTEFEWSTFDLRSAAQPSNVEGAAAPTAQERVRGNVTNVVQIHQEKVSVAYSKLAATAQKSGTNNAAVNNVPNELDWQVSQMLKQMVRDAEYSFINGTYQKPGNNSTGRQTRGLISAITSNVVTVSGSALPTVTATASTDLVNSTSHGLVAGDTVIFSSLTGGAGLTTDTTYYVIASGLTTNVFKVSLQKNGPAVDITSDASAATAVKAGTALSTTLLGDLLQSVYDNGGIAESDTATIICNSSQKRAISKAYAGAYGQYQELSRTVGGVAVSTIVTDFGTLNVMLNRYVPQHKLIVASLEQCAPVFLEVPDPNGGFKGHFFAEPLAKTGASDDVQLYGEVGLAYGNEKAHGVISGLAA